MYEPIRGGTRGGAAEFKWTDVSADKDREHYLGHSINAPTGRWQKNKDVHWYNRDKGQTALERAEELKRVKEAEEEALSVALGFKPTIRSDPDAPSAADGENAADNMQPSEDIQKVLATERLKREKAERKAEKEKRRVEKEQRRAARHDRRQERREQDERRRYDREPARHYEDREYASHRRERKESYTRPRSPPMRDYPLRHDVRHHTRSLSRSLSPPSRIDRDDRYRQAVRRSPTPSSPPRRRGDHADERMRDRSPPNPLRRERHSPNRSREGGDHPSERTGSPPRRNGHHHHPSRSVVRNEYSERHGAYRRRSRSPPPRRAPSQSPPLRRRNDSPGRRSRSRSPHPIVVP